MRNILLTFFATACIFLAFMCYGFMTGRLTYYIYVQTEDKGYTPKEVAEKQQLMDFYVERE